MKTFKKTLTILLLIFLVSCSKDENAPVPKDPTQSVYRIKQTLNSNGSTESYEYNAQNKIIKMTYSGGSFEKFTYNSQGLILSAESAGNVNTNQNAITNYVYDASGIKIEEIRTRSDGNKYKYVYTNSNGLPITSKYYNWNSTTNVWVESTGNRVTYTYNSSNQVTRTQTDSNYISNTYDARGNSNEYKQHNKKPDGTYYLAYQANYTFDDKKAIQYGPFIQVNKNNPLEIISKTYLADGSLSNQSSGTYSYEYNEASYVTKQSYNGALFATFTLEKVN